MILLPWPKGLVCLLCTFLEPCPEHDKLRAELRTAVRPKAMTVYISPTKVLRAARAIDSRPGISGGMQAVTEALKKMKTERQRAVTEYDVIKDLLDG